jgi:hypothetical protein
MVKPQFRNLAFILLLTPLSATTYADESSNWGTASAAVFAVPCMGGSGLSNSPKCVRLAMQATCKDIKNEAARLQCFDQIPAKPQRKARAKPVADNRLANVAGTPAKETPLGEEPFGVELLLSPERAAVDEFGYRPGGAVGKD